MLIVITLPTFIPHEADAIVALFEQRGIDYLHLRKPGATEAEVEALLKEIPVEYYPRITMHDFHALAQKFGVGGIHLTGRNPEAPAGWQGRLSTSCHSIEELEQKKRDGIKVGEEQRRFDYLSLSPIFDSISKQGYRAAFSHEQLLQAKVKGIIDPSVLALGGITFDRIPEVLTLGFGGAMILGDAWRTKHVVLSIAGSDSSAGAGIQQDLKVITSLGNYAATVITAVTAQNTLGVQGVLPISGEMVARQMRSVLDDMDVRAVKIGMIPSLDVAKAIVSELSNPSNSSNHSPLPSLPIILDPVMISTSGTRLMAEECVSYVVQELMPLCTLVTPNLPEMQMLEPMLQGHYPTNFLIKGGHAEGEEMTDRLLMLDGSVYSFTEQRIATHNLHGTGCTLSSAIASYLADGLSLPDAVRSAKACLTRAILKGRQYTLGHGNGPLIF